MKLHYIAALFLAVILYSCSGRDEIVNPFTTTSGPPIEIYSKNGNVDSIACNPNSSKTNIKFLDSINFNTSDSIKISFQYNACMSNSSSLSLFYFNIFGDRITFYTTTLPSTLTLKEAVIISPLVNTGIYTELFTSSSNDLINCISIKNLKIFKQ